VHLLHSRNNWRYSEGSEPTIDFCLWVLQVDGLHVPPFDQHSDGDGSLRARGLTAEDWQSWFLRVMDHEQKKQDIEQLRQLHLANYLKISNEPDLEHLQQRRKAEHFKTSTQPPLPPPPEFRYHLASWKGSAAVKDRLIELDEQYKQVSSQHERICDDLSRAQLKDERRTGSRLYDELKPYFSRIPPLHIYLAVYEFPLDYIVLPATLLMTVQEGQPQAQEHRERVLAAAAELAAQSGRRRQSLYTRIENAGQFIAAYRRHSRKAVPPAPPRQAIPRLEDAARQTVFDDLSNERSFYGIVDLTSVQFLREKNRDGWRLYEITFQETDGEQQRMIFILQRNEDGSWRHHGGGSSSDMQNQWFKFFPPVHDHPLLFLGTSWTRDDNQQYLLTAHGHVIDNGFQVKRVRLINDAGQILEDAVEDGYVFFACTLEQQIRLPMQAELYNNEGKFVWQQTVPDQGLPPWMKRQ
jgi:hypothetical protein